MNFVAVFTYSTQTGIETWAHVSSCLSIGPTTTVAEVMIWAKAKRASTAISLEIQELEQANENR